MMDRLTIFVCVVGAATAMGGCGGVGDADTTVEVAMSALETDCVPGPSQTAVFLNSNGTGTCLRLGMINLATIAQTGIPDNSIGSVKIGAGARLVLFSDAHYGGTKTILTANTNGLPRTASSLRSEAAADACESPTYQPPSGAVAVYRDPTFLGDCTVLHAGYFCTGGGGAVGAGPDYGDPEWCIGLADNSISSAHFGAHTSLRLYDQTWFRGISATLSNTSGAPLAVSNLKTFRVNDLISSAIITSP